MKKELVLSLFALAASVGTVGASTFNLSGGVLTQADLIDSASERVDATDPNFDNEFVSYDYLGNALKSDGSFVLRQRQDVSDLVGATVDVSGEIDGSGVPTTTSTTTSTNVINRETTQKLSSSSLAADVVAFGKSLSVSAVSNYLVLSNSIFDTSDNFISASTAVILQNDSDLNIDSSLAVGWFFEVPTVERLVSWEQGCCSNPDLIKVETLTESTRKLALSSFSISATLNFVPDDPTMFDLSSLTSDDLLSPISVGLFFEDVGPFAPSGKARGGGLALSYAFDLVPPPSTVPLPAGMPLILIGVGAFAFVRRARRHV